MLCFLVRELVLRFELVFVKVINFQIYQLRVIKIYFSINLYIYNENFRMTD